MDSKSKFSLAEGFTDYWNGDVNVREHIKTVLANYFKLYGYSKLDLPLIERQDFFSVEMVGSHPWPGWHPKSLTSVTIKDYTSTYDGLPTNTDNYVLIPEGTTSLCRWIAKSIESSLIEVSPVSPLRLFYITPCFRNELINSLSETKQRQFTQIGLELLGPEGIDADIEAIYLMITGLEKIGFPKKGLRTRFSDVRIFNHLINKNGINKHLEYQIKDTLDRIASHNAKHSVRSEELNAKFDALLEKAGLVKQEREKWSYLTSGTYYDLGSIQELSNSLGIKEVYRDAIDIMTAFKKLGVVIYFDPSIIRSQEYYTSTVFQADVITEGRIISEIAGGGRYDRFVANFLKRYGAKKQKQVPATGFAYSLERLATIWRELSLNHKTKITLDPVETRVDTVIYSTDISRAIKESRKLADKEVKVELFHGRGGLKAARRYSNKLNSNLLTV